MISNNGTSLSVPKGASLSNEAADHLPAGSKCVVFDQNLSQLTADEIVLVDLPQNLAQLEFVLINNCGLTLPRHSFLSTEATNFNDLG